MVSIKNGNFSFISAHSADFGMWATQEKKIRVYLGTLLKEEILRFRGSNE